MNNRVNLACLVLLTCLPGMLWGASKELVVIPSDETELSNVSTLERANAVVQEYMIGPHDLLEIIDLVMEEIL